MTMTIESDKVKADGDYSGKWRSEREHQRAMIVTSDVVNGDSKDSGTQGDERGLRW